MSRPAEAAEKYPLCTKLAERRPDSRAIFDFLEWLRERGYTIAEYLGDRPAAFLGENKDTLFVASKSDHTLWLEYLEIDADKLEQERRAMLDAQRKANERTGT